MNSSITKILHLSIESVPKTTYMDIIKEINNFGMEEIDNPPTNLGDSLIPNFDKFQSFRYITDDKQILLIEVLGINNDILQIRIMILYNKPILSFVSVMKSNFKTIVFILNKLFGDSYAMTNNNIEILNWQNEEKALYTHTMRQNNMDVITINVGNRKYYG